MLSACRRDGGLGAAEVVYDDEEDLGVDDDLLRDDDFLALPACAEGGGEAAAGEEGVGEERDVVLVRWRRGRGWCVGVRVDTCCVWVSVREGEAVCVRVVDGSEGLHVPYDGLVVDVDVCETLCRRGDGGSEGDGACKARGGRGRGGGSEVGHGQTHA